MAGVTPATYAIFGSIAAYSALHAISFGPITWLVLAEIFPAAVKGKAMGIATTVNRCTSFIAALTFLTMCDRLQWGGTFYVYAGFAAFALVFYAALVPETTGASQPRSNQVVEPKAVRPGQTLVSTGTLLRTLIHCLLHLAGLPLEEISPLFDSPRKLVRRNLAALRSFK